MSKMCMLPFMSIETTPQGHCKVPRYQGVNTPRTKPQNPGPKWAHEKRRQEGKARES